MKDGVCFGVGVGVGVRVGVRVGVGVGVGVDVGVGVCDREVTYEHVHAFMLMEFSRLCMHL